MALVSRLTAQRAASSPGQGSNPLPGEESRAGTNSLIDKTGIRLQEHYNPAGPRSSCPKEAEALAVDPTVKREAFILQTHDHRLLSRAFKWVNVVKGCCCHRNPTDCLLRPVPAPW